MLVAALCLAAASTPSKAERPIQVQRYDRSCGPAAVATLLSWAGFDISEEALIAALRRVAPLTDENRREGFSIAQLARAIHDLGLGVSLEQRYLTPGEFKQNAQLEPLIVRLIESSDRPGYGTGHFTIVDGFSPRRGFRRADSLDGTYTFHPEDAFIAAALVSSRELGGQYIAVLRLRRAGAPVLSAQPVTADDEQRLLGTPRSRLLESMAPLSSGGSQIVTSVSHGSSRFAVPELAGFQFREGGWTTSLQLRHGLSPNTEIFAQVSGNTSRLAARLPDDPEMSVRMRSVAVDPLAVGVSTRLPISPAPGWLVTGTALALLDPRPAIKGLAGGVDALWQIDEDWRLQAGGRVSFARSTHAWMATASVTAGMARQLNSRVTAFGEIGIDFAMTGDRSPGGTIRIAVNYSLGDSWALQPFVEQSLFGGGDFSATAIGLSVAYQLPRALGR